MPLVRSRKARGEMMPNMHIGRARQHGVTLRSQASGLRIALGGKLRVTRQDQTDLRTLPQQLRAELAIDQRQTVPLEEIAFPTDRRGWVFGAWCWVLGFGL